MSGKPTKSVVKPLKKMDSSKPKQKISLQEYRERSKSKSPRKPDESDEVSEPVESPEAQKGLESRTKRSNDGEKEADLRGEDKVVSESDDENDDDDDDVIDVSFDLNSMSISDRSKKSEKKDRVVGGTGSDKTTDNLTVSVDKSKPKLNKSSSDLQDGVSKNKVPDESSRKASSDLASVPLSERVKSRTNSGNSTSKESSSMVNKSKSEVMPDVIDLTSDEESPVPKPVKVVDQSVKPKVVPVMLNSSSAMAGSQKHFVEGSKSFQANPNSTMPSFELLNKQAGLQTIAPKPDNQSRQGNQWTVVRNAEFQSAKATLNQSLKEDLKIKQQLIATLEKQKVRCS